MNILGIDTATMAGSIAIITEHQLVAETTVNTKTTHTERLLPMLDHTLRAASLTIQQIDGIAVASGPGSFTGLRIGVTTAKSLAYSIQKPVVGIPALDALASQFLYTDVLICPLLDARKQEVYTALYRNRGDRVHRISEYSVIAPKNLLQALHEPTLFLGDGVLAYRQQICDVLGNHALFANPALMFPRASLIAKLGLDRLMSGTPDDAFVLTPLYLRKSDAEIHWELAQQSIKKDLNE